MRALALAALPRILVLLSVHATVAAAPFAPFEPKFAKPRSDGAGFPASQAEKTQAEKTLPKVTPSEKAPLDAPLPDPRELLALATRWIGAVDRVAAIQSYRATVKATQRFRTKESQQWIDLPTKAVVLWHRNGQASLCIEETVIGPDGEDLTQKRETGRIGGVAWERAVGSGPPVFHRVPAISDPLLRADPFRVILVESPCHAERFAKAESVSRERVRGIDAVRVDLAASEEELKAARDGRPVLAGAVRSIWIDEQTGETVAVRALPTDERTIVLAWQEIGSLRIPVEIRSTALFGRDTASVATVEIELDCVKEAEVTMPAALHDPAAILPAAGQPTTDDS